MSARYGRTFVSVTAPLSADVRADLVKQGYEIDETLAVAQRFEPGEVDLEDPSETAAPWAGAFEHVWYVGVHERDDVFVYTHRVWGALVRSFEYCGSAAGWSNVVGDPEPWERGFLLSEAELERGAKYLGLGFSSATDRAQKIADLRRVHEGGVTPARKGQMLPICSPDAWAAALPDYFLRGATSAPRPIPSVSTPAAPAVVALPGRASPSTQTVAPPSAGRAQLAASIANEKLPDFERARAVREALKSSPDLVTALRRSGAIPPKRLPEDNRPWDASNPVNQQSIAFPTDEARLVAAISADTTELASALTGSDKRRIVLALELLETLAAHDPEGAGTLEPSLRPLLRDGRSPEHGRGIPTVRAVAGFFSMALPVHAVVYARSPSPWEALVSAMDAAIAANVIPWLARHFLRLAEARIDAARVADTLVSWIEERARPAASRARARAVLTLLADNGGGASSRSHVGRPWQGAPPFMQRADDAFVRVLEDPTESEELKNRIRNALGK